MAQIDYTSTLSGTSIGTTETQSTAVLVSVPFKDPDPHDDWLWYGHEGFHRFVDFFGPRAITKVYDALSKKDAREKLDRMLNGTKAQFMKIADFAFKSVKMR